MRERWAAVSPVPGPPSSRLQHQGNLPGTLAAQWEQFWTGSRARTLSLCQASTAREQGLSLEKLMTLYSTKNQRLRATFLEAVERGSPGDGGLYMPEDIPFFSG